MRCFLLTHPCPSQVVYQSAEDKVTVIGAGITLHEALAAAEMLKKGTVQLQPDLKKYLEPRTELYRDLMIPGCGHSLFSACSNIGYMR
jgi:hypothetical protein